MQKLNINLVFHLVAQILAQSAVVELIPVQYKPVFSAVLAIVGVFVAFLDTSASQTQ